MEQYETDEQRGEAFKVWLAKNVPIIILGIVLGLGGVYGFNYYQGKVTQKEIVNADVFYELLQTANQKDTDATRKFATELSDGKDNPGYYVLAQLELANIHAKNNQTEQALSILDALIANTQDTSLKALAQYRAARLSFEQNDMENTLMRLSTLTDAGFQGLRKELEGDAYLIQSKTDKAIAAFEAAIIVGNATELLAMKLERLGVTPSKKPMQ